MRLSIFNSWHKQLLRETCTASQKIIRFNMTSTKLCFYFSICKIVSCWQCCFFLFVCFVLFFFLFLFYLDSFTTVPELLFHVCHISTICAGMLDILSIRRILRYPLHSGKSIYNSTSHTWKHEKSKVMVKYVF